MSICSDHDPAMAGVTERSRGLLVPRRHFLALSALSAAGLPAERAVAQAAPRRPGRHGQIVMGLSQEPTRFHPLQARIEVDEGVHINLFSALWGISPTGDFVPDLVTEVPSVANGGISADGLEWRIKLRSGVTWHDGAPFSAEDVKFTLELLQNPNFPAMSRNGHTLLRDIQVVSPTEIAWKMERFFAPYLSILAWTFIVPRHILGRVTDHRDPAFNNNPVGTGPFKWGERRPGDYVRLEANDRYFGEGPFVERVIFKYIPDMTVLKTQFVAGAVDAVGISGITPDNYAEVRRTPGVTLHESPTSFVTFFALNNGIPQFRDPAVRKALYAAMDKEAINRDLFYNANRPTESFLPQENWAHNPNLPRHRHDPAAAARMLDEAGWRRGAGGVRAKNGVRLSFACSTVAGNHLREQVQQFLQQTWRPLGVEMTIRNFPAAVMWGDFWRNSEWESTIVGAIYPAAGDPDVGDRLGSWAIPKRSGAGANQMQYENPEVDRLLRESVGLLDREQRRANYLKVQEIVRDDLPAFPLHQTLLGEGTKKGLHGYQPNINYRSNAWNLRQWYWAA